jgi:hypothetical protein
MACLKNNGNVVFTVNPVGSKRRIVLFMSNGVVLKPRVPTGSGFKKCAFKADPDITFAESAARVMKKGDEDRWEIVWVDKAWADLKPAPTKRLTWGRNPGLLRAKANQRNRR